MKSSNFNFFYKFKVRILDFFINMFSFFALYYDGKYYDVFPKGRKVGKILLLVEEMHRMHVNNWKNFPWMDTYK